MTLGQSIPLSPRQTSSTKLSNKVQGLVQIVARSPHWLEGALTNTHKHPLHLRWNACICFSLLILIKILTNQAKQNVVCPTPMIKSVASLIWQKSFRISWTQKYLISLLTISHMIRAGHMHIFLFPCEMHNYSEELKKFWKCNLAPSLNIKLKHFIFSSLIAESCILNSKNRHIDLEASLIFFEMKCQHSLLLK